MITLNNESFAWDPLKIWLQAWTSHSGSCSPRCHHMIWGALKKLLLGWMHICDPFSRSRKKPKTDSIQVMLWKYHIHKIILVQKYMFTNYIPFNWETPFKRSWTRQKTTLKNYRCSYSFYCYLQYGCENIDNYSTLIPSIWIF